MFKTVVCGTDGSDNAVRALSLAADLAEREHGTLHVVHVIERYYGGRGTGLTQRADEPETDDAIAAAVRALDGRPFTCVTHWPHSNAGDASEPIAAVARDVDADVIVVGTRGHSRLAGLLLGSVTQQLLHEAPCPVLAVPPLKHMPVTGATTPAAAAEAAASS